MASQPDRQTPTRQAGRSPSYPFFSVQKALDQARALHKQEGMHWAPLTSAVGAWGYSPKSSGGRQTLATMRYYALIEVTGEGDARRVRISDTAKRILLDEREDDTEKRALIRDVALSPSAHRALYQEYKDGLPSDNTVLHFLMLSKHFNKEAARDLLEEYKETASYVSLYEPQESVDKTGAEEDDHDDEPELPAVKAGDKIQWTSQGVDQFPEGGYVLGLSEDGLWVFTDQTATGVPVKDVKIMEALAPTPPLVTPPKLPAHLLAGLKRDDGADIKPPAGSRRAVFPLEDGDVTLVFPEGLSSDGLKDLSAYLDIFLKKEIRKSDVQKLAEVDKLLKS